MTAIKLYCFRVASEHIYTPSYKGCATLRYTYSTFLSYVIAWKSICCLSHFLDNQRHKSSAISKE